MEDDICWRIIKWVKYASDLTLPSNSSQSQIIFRLVVICIPGNNTQDIPILVLFVFLGFVRYMHV